MNILLTNDDGIASEGIYALYLELKKIAKVTVVAPDSERSSIGHAITLAHPIRYKTLDRNGKFFGYGISGTPADCVKFGISVLLKKKPDLVFSGINIGPNDGCSVFYSGTVAGAREGALMGIPSVAISLNSYVKPYFLSAARFAVKLAGQIRRNSLPNGTFLNVNVPNKPYQQIKGVKALRQGTTPIHGTFKKRKHPDLGSYYWMSGKTQLSKKNDQSDTFALSKDYITVTPIHSDLTDYHVLEQLKSWHIT